jgi:hypothetical protein
MSQIIPIYIPTYISDQNYAPTRVQPRLLYYNGQVECEPYYLVDSTGLGHEISNFPYFDNYSVQSGSQFPTTGSKSLLFFNEQPVYGSTPTASLYSTYWSDYVNLLYNPRTRLINASAIIPLADYFKMELNDIVEFRGNYYHLRAINDYNLKNGECKIQLLGPILPDSLPFIEDAQPVEPTTTTTTTTSTTTTSTTTTSTTTTTTTTEAPCDCKYYDVNVSQDDLDEATGNSIFLNFTLYVEYTDCDNNQQIRTYNAAGTYTDDFCALDNTFIYLNYYQNDNIALASFSTVDESGDCCTTTTTTTEAPALTSYTGSGYGNSEANACSDSTNNRTLYSDCGPFDFGVGCFVYVDTVPNPLIGYDYVFINGAVWDIDNSTGQITAYSSVQC